MSLDLNLGDADGGEDAETPDDCQDARPDELPEPALAAIDLALAEHETPTDEQFVIRVPVSVSPTAEGSEALDPHDAEPAAATPVTIEPGPAEVEAGSAEVQPDDDQRFQGAVVAIDAALRGATLEPNPRVVDLLEDRADPREVTPRFALPNLMSFLGWRGSMPSEPSAPIEPQQEHAVRLKAVRREAEAPAAQVAELEAQAAQQIQEPIEAQVQEPIEVQVEAAVSEIRAETTGALAEATRQHDSALVAMQAELDNAEARQMEHVEQVERERDFAARAEAARREAEVAHAAEMTELKAQAAQQIQEQIEAQIELAVSEVRAEMTSALAEATQQHDAALVAMQAELDNAKARQVEQVEGEQDFVARADAARREAEVAHAAQVTELEAQAGRQIEVQVELAVSEAQVETAVSEVRAEMSGALTEATQQYNAALVAVRAELENVKARHVEEEQTLTAFRAEADLAQAELERVYAEQAERVEQASRESHRNVDELAELETLLSATRAAHVTAAETFAKKQAETAKLREAAAARRSAPPDPGPTSPDGASPIPVAVAWPSLHALDASAPPVGRRGILWITSSVALGCLTGSLVGWYVVFVWIV